MGRPTKYKPEYCKDIIKFFDYELTTFDVVENRVKAVNPKFLTTFAESIGVTRDTLTKWSKNFPEFLLAYKRAKQKMVDNIIQGGLIGIYNSGVACFTLKNIAGWRDKTEIETKGEVKHTHTVEPIDIEERANQLIEQRAMIN